MGKVRRDSQRKQEPIQRSFVPLEDDEILVGKRTGRRLPAAWELAYVLRYNDFVRIAVTALIDTRNRVNAADVL